MLASTLKHQLKEQKKALLEDYPRNTSEPSPQKLITALALSVDDALIALWQSHKIPTDCALVAVGGYGRSELFPGSDVDVLVLISAPPNQLLTEKLEKLIQDFWDLGLEIGHSIRTIDECIEESNADITTKTALLESRFIFGDATLFRELGRKYRDSLDPCAFYQAKILELRQRHAKYENTPYSLEPNCKESPGGLRDLQAILWVSRAANLGNSWSELAQNGLITSSEAQQLGKIEGAFKDIRIRLHRHARRREDRLVFDIQSAIASTFGFTTTGDGTQLLRASEYLMQRYYWAAKAVTQLNTLLLQNIEAKLFPRALNRRSLNANFDCVNELLDIANDDLFERNPSAMLEAFFMMQKHSQLHGMSPRTLRALWHNRNKIDNTFRNNRENRTLFLKILQYPSGITHALRNLNQTSILGKYLPSFRRIVGQMQHDLFHVYTVDQHILMVVRNVRRFCLPEHAHEYPFCSQLMANFSQPWRLFTAALFHDIAKGRGGDHSKLGMLEAKHFCKMHLVSKEDTSLIVFLVEHHLTMSIFAQKRDITDPEVIREFAKIVGDDERLTALYLLTVADIRGTSPKVWNGWKAKLLEDLYNATLAMLGEGSTSREHQLQARQNTAYTQLRLDGLPDTAHKTFWAYLDISYFLRHEADDIAWQTRILYTHVYSPTPIVAARLAAAGAAIQITAYTKDKSDIFARICSYFDRKNFSILDARIHTTKHGYALDTFMVTQSDFENHYHDIINLIEDELSRLLESTEALPAPIQGRLSRLSRTFPVTPTIDLHPDEQGKFFLLFINANDRNGLLYAIALVLTHYQINLHTAKVMTLGDRVEDVFLISGAILNNPRKQIQFETELLKLLKIQT